MGAIQRMLKPAMKYKPSSRIFVNLTRPKCEALESRLCEMLFPTDDQLADLQLMPNPNLPFCAPVRRKGMTRPRRFKGRRRSRRVRCSG